MWVFNRSKTKRNQIHGQSTGNYMLKLINKKPFQNWHIAKVDRSNSCSTHRSNSQWITVAINEPGKLHLHWQLSSTFKKACTSVWERRGGGLLRARTNEEVKTVGNIPTFPCINVVLEMHDLNLILWINLSGIHL